ncbi:MAG: hypothetical protein IPL46_16700 [Saprospiraceae bacterium]|nr:hypothetical protein [Saprospiraceae bacterium]
MSAKYLIVFLTLLFFNSVQAQVINVTENKDDRKGKHYRFPEFQEGIINRQKGDPSKAQLNYNLLTEELIIDLNRAKIAYEPVSAGERITIANIDFLPIDDVVYEVLYNGEVTLLVHRKQTMERTGQETGLGRTSNTYSSTTNTYKSEDEFLPTLKDKHLLYELILLGNFGLMDAQAYFLLAKNELIPFRKLKQLEKVFPELENKIQEYIKAEKIRIDREEDLIKVLTFCNAESK